jgi:hypothetical protein
MRRADPLRRKLAENSSRQCMLGLSELSKSWPVGGWILQLFVHLMERLTGHDFNVDKKPRSNKRKRNPTSESQAGSDGQFQSSAQTFHAYQSEQQAGNFGPTFNFYRDSFGGSTQTTLQQQLENPSSTDGEALWSPDRFPMDFLLQDSLTRSLLEMRSGAALEK